MASHSSTLAWRIPWTEEPGRLQSMGLLRIGHDWATSLSLFTFMHWRRKWQPTPVFLPGESQWQRSLLGCRLWGRTESGHSWRVLAADTWWVVQSLVTVSYWYVLPEGQHCQKTAGQAQKWLENETLFLNVQWLWASYHPPYHSGFCSARWR